MEATMQATVLDYLKNGYHQICPVVELKQIISDIKTGVYQDPIEQLRIIKQTSKDEYSKRKRVILPAFFAGAVYKEDIPENKKSNAVISNFNKNLGCAVLDFDNVDPQPLKEYFKSKPYCVFFFVSPSGTGLKVGVAHQEISDYQQLRALKKSLKFDDWVMELIDPACLDNASLKCFVSYDPNAYYNKDYVPMQVKIPKPKKPAVKKKPGQKGYRPPVGVYGRLNPFEVEELLEVIAPFIVITKHQEYFTVACVLSLYGREDLWYSVLQNNDWSQYEGSKEGFDKDLADKTYAECRDEGKTRMANDQAVKKYWHLFPLLQGFTPTLHQKLEWHL